MVRAAMSQTYIRSKKSVSEPTLGGRRGGWFGGQTYPDLLILCTGSQVLAIWAEADAANVKVAILVNVLVLERRHILTRGHIEDLRRAVAARRQILAVPAEANTAHHTVVIKVVHQLDIQHPLYLWVKDGVPIRSLTFLRCRQVLWVPVSERIADAIRAEESSLTRSGRGTRHLVRSTWIRVGDVRLLGCGRRGGTAAFARAWRGGRRWWGRSITYADKKKTSRVSYSETFPTHANIPFTAAPGGYPPNELCGGCGAPGWATEAGCG